MKLLLLILLLPSLGSAGVEIGIGVAQAEKPTNGRWYQRELRHNLGLTSPVFSAGYRFHTTDNLDLRIGYKYLGKFSSEADATASDQNYANWRSGKETLWPLSHWKGEGVSHGVYLIAEYNFNRFFISAGAVVQKSSWTMKITDLRSTTNGPTRSQVVKGDNSTEIAPMLGVGSSFNNFRLTYEIHQIIDKSKYPSAYHGYHQSVNLIYEF